MKTRSILTFVSSFLIPASAHAQCDVNTSSTGAYLTMGNPESGLTQPPGDWQFRRGSSTGPLLSGIGPLWQTFGAWGSPAYPYSIPVVGPLYSNNSLRNQNPYYYAQPKFEGLMVHPGDGIDTFVVFTAATTLHLATATVLAEVLGGPSSNGTLIDLRVERAAGGPSITLVNATYIPPRPTNDSPYQTLIGSGLPLSLNVGDRVVFRSNSNGPAVEDWLNADVRLAFDGSSAPILLHWPAEVVSGCLGQPFSLHVDAHGATAYQWLKDGSPLSDDGHVTGSLSSTLMLDAFTAADLGSYVCTVSDSCGSRTTPNSEARTCLGEYNCDGGVDGADVSAFFQDWENGNYVADLNGDGGVDGGDVQVFFDRWSSGC